MAYLSVASFATNVTSWYSRNDMRDFTLVILHMNIIIMYRSVTVRCLFEIIHCSDVFARRHKLLEPEKNFQANTCRLFSAKIWRHISITSQLRKGPILRDAIHILLKERTCWQRSFHELIGHRTQLKTKKVNFLVFQKFYFDFEVFLSKFIKSCILLKFIKYYKKFLRRNHTFYP